MSALKRYYFYFFLICFVMTCLCGVLAALMPQGMGAILTIVPYLLAMMASLYIFLNREKRAPSAQERKKLSLGFTLIYWLYNLSFLMLGILIAQRQNPQAWSDFLLYLQQPQFISVVIIMLLLIAIPLYLLTYWFFGPQAKRMAQKKFPQ